MLYAFLFGYQRTLKCKWFQKSNFNAQNTRAENQKRYIPFRLTAPELILRVYFVQSIDNDVRISLAVFGVNPIFDIR